MKRVPCFTLIFLAVLSSVHAEEFPIKGTFFEKILTVQEEKLRLPEASHGKISIPYTRVDVAIDNGIAITRLIQVYHNHGTTNEGFAFSMPITRDTAITQFCLWDQGKRYVGAIEERTKAENAYNEITGDEAPTMNKDPGLVRQTGNRYEMRVFPILPGENKQIELISHQRLSMNHGKFFLNLPFNTISQPNDPRHGSVECQRTEVSICLKDNLPVEEVTITGIGMKERRLDDHRRLYTQNFSRGKITDALFEYQVRLDNPSSVVPLTFSQGNDHFFSMRIISRTPESYPNSSRPSLAPQREHSFYIGVWRDKSEEVNLDEVFDFADGRAMSREVLASLTLMALDHNSRFHASYIPPTIHVEGYLRETLTKAFLKKYIVTDKKHQVNEFWDVFEDLLERPSINNTRRSFDEVVQHLNDAIGKDDCEIACLFLGNLTKP